MGYVTAAQMRQVLVFLSLEASEQELALLDARYSDAKGFNYLNFLKAVDPPAEVENVYRSKVTQMVAKKDKVCIIPRDRYGIWYN